MTPDILFLVHLLCWSHKVEPAYALAVARIESGTKHQTYRFGRMGHSPFYGPFGVHRCFLKTGSPEEVIQVGIKALRNTAGNQAKMVARLCKYNEHPFKDNYLRDVLARYHELKREGN